MTYSAMRICLGTYMYLDVLFLRDATPEKPKYV
jgi:hypothetical protein